MGVPAACGKVPAAAGMGCRGQGSYGGNGLNFLVCCLFENAPIL